MVLAACLWVRVGIGLLGTPITGERNPSKAHRIAVLSQLTELSAVSLVSVTEVTSDGSVTADSDDNKQLNCVSGKYFRGYVSGDV